MRIAFCWTNGVRDKEVFNHWNDGLRAAMRLIEQGHEVTYHEPDDEIPTVDWILYWEAPCTHDSIEDGHKYRKLYSNPQRKALLFAGGPIKKEWVDRFDHIFVESKINADELDAMGIKNSTAFGVNTDIFYPQGVEAIYKTETHGACASWKRQWLVAEAMGGDALIFGRFQESDPAPFVRSREHGAMVLSGQKSYEETARYINKARIGVNCADYWGGGQRATLEAMACGLPVIVMSDSPKNREYIEESGGGLICSPDAPSIRNAVEILTSKDSEYDARSKDAIEYVKNKWTHRHYRDAILNVISK